MTTSSAAKIGSASAWRASGAGSRLSFAASPTFALMAWTAASGPPLCSAGAAMLPFDSMTAMYLLMSLFHLPPWLKFASRARH